MGRGLALALLLALLPAQAAEPYSRGLLWKVERAGAPPSHVFGTIHLADPRALAIPPPVLAALEASRAYAMEVPLWDAHDWHMLEAAQYDDGRRLEAEVGPATYAAARAALAARGIPDKVIERMKPWAALANIAVTPAGYGSETLDEKLFALARGRGLRIQALEGTEEHISVFEGIPPDSQRAMLRHILENRDWLAGRIEPTLQAWLKRDLAGIRRVDERVGARFPAMAPHYRAFMRHVVDNRNVAMAHRLHLPLRAGGVFVAVGANHLYGANGLLARIARQGYRVTRMY